MSIFFVAWLLMSMFLLGFWGWTIHVLLRQKNAWKVYAEKRKMRYHSQAFFETPAINGAVEEYSVSMFASEHGELDARSQRRLTAVELSLHTALPFPLGIGSGGMVHIVEGLDIRQEFKPAVKGWDDSYILRTGDIQLAQLYLTEDRLKKLVNFMKIDKSWVVFLCVGDQAILRLDTPLPIDDPKEIDILIKQMINVARGLELEKGEIQDMIRNRDKAGKVSAVLDIDDDLLDDHIGFELEDDEMVEEVLTVEDIEDLSEQADKIDKAPEK